jgi:Zn-dependent M28 family amino/carboxypeptidase
LHAVDLANLVSPPEGLPKVVLGTHYDTIRLKGGTFVGANDGASGVGVLLELARVLPEAPLELVFFDGEETLGGAPSGLHGSRHYVRRRPEAVAAAIVVDMVGDRDLRLCREQFSSATLLDRLFAIGRDLGYATVLTGPELKVEDDHVPFLDAGLEAALLLDYGDGAGPGQPPYWHTLLDTLDNLAPGSLEAVGRILYEYGQSLDR